LTKYADSFGVATHGHVTPVRELTYLFFDSHISYGFIHIPENLSRQGVRPLTKGGGHYSE
jgi:hypothetical protein